MNNLVKLLSLSICLFWSIGAWAQSEVDDSMYIHTHYIKYEYGVPMRDGKTLYTTAYVPRDTVSQKYPMLLNRTPYSCSPYGEKNYTTRLNMYMHLVREGYIFVYQDVRGRYMSEGDFVDVRPHNPNKKGKETDESSDTYDTVDWLLSHVPGNNGKVGQFGISYPGFYSSAGLPGAHPAMKAVSPQAPVTDWFIGDDFHHNGALMLMDAFDFYYGFGRPRPTVTMEGQPGFDYPHNDSYRFHLEVGALQNYNTRFMHGEIPFWNDLMSHPNYDAWWKARNIRPHLNDIKPAVMTVGGLFDAEDCFGAFATYQAIEKQSKGTYNILVEGPWFHGGWARSNGQNLGNVWFDTPTAAYYRQEIELPFFNYFLKGKGAAPLPEAYIFVTGENKWHQYATWPPAGVTPTKFYLTEKGGISTTKPTIANSFDEYVSDPAHPVPYTEDVHLDRTREYMTDDQRFAARRPDVVTFQTPTLTEDITLTGPVLADLVVSITGTDADFVVKLIDVFPDSMSQNPASKVPMGGYQMLVRGEIMRGRYRNSLENPTAFKPNEIAHVKLTLPDVAHTFRAGHRIMVQVQSSWFPLADLNPQQFVNIYTCTDADFIKSVHRIFHDATNASNIELPIKK